MRRSNGDRSAKCYSEKTDGRGGEIRTPDPHNPIVVRYQAALRPDRYSKVFEGDNNTYREADEKEILLTPKDLNNLFKFQT